MPSVTETDTDGRPKPLLGMPVDSAGNISQYVHGRVPALACLSGGPPQVMDSLPRLIDHQHPDSTTDGILVGITLPETDLYIAFHTSTTPRLRATSPERATNLPGFLDFSNHRLTAMVTWLDRRLEDDKTMVGPADRALCTQDSPGLRVTKARAFSTLPTYFEWKHTHNHRDMSDSQVHPETEAERGAFSRDSGQCTDLIILSFERRAYRTYVFTDHNGGRSLLLASLRGGPEAGAAWVGQLLAGFPSVAGHHDSDEVGTPDIRLVTSSHHRVRFSCGPAAAKIFNTLLGEQNVGLAVLSLMDMPGPRSGRHGSPGESMADCTRSGSCDAISAILKVHLTSNISPLLGPAVGGGSVAGTMAGVSGVISFTGSGFPAQLDNRGRRIQFRTPSTQDKTASKACSLSDISTARLQPSRVTSTHGISNMGDTYLPSGLGIQSSRVAIPYSTTSHGGGAPTRAGPAGASITTRLAGNINTSGTSETILARLGALDRRKADAIRRRLGSYPGSKAWMAEDVAVSGLSGEISKLLDELTRRNDGNI